MIVVVVLIGEHRMFLEEQRQSNRTNELVFSKTRHRMNIFSDQKLGDFSLPVALTSLDSC